MFHLLFFRKLATIQCARWTSKTLGRRCTNVIQMFCVCWCIISSQNRVPHSWAKPRVFIEWTEQKQATKFTHVSYKTMKKGIMCWPTTRLTKSQTDIEFQCIIIKMVLTKHPPNINWEKLISGWLTLHNIIMVIPIWTSMPHLCWQNFIIFLPELRISGF